MRYRRLSYRYALVVAAGEPRPLSPLGLAETRAVRLAQMAWRPAVDIYETADRVFVTVEVAGVDPDSIDVLLYEDAAIIEGERRIPPPEGGGFYQAAEIAQGRFRLELPLPCRIDSEQVDARYDAGLLQVVLPKGGGRQADDR